VGLSTIAFNELNSSCLEVTPAGNRAPNQNQKGVSMKTMILSLAMLCSSASFAYTSDTPWAVLMKDRRLKLDAPVVFMGHAIDYTFVCRTGDKLRTIKPVEKIQTIYRGKEHQEDRVIGYEYLYTPIHGTRTVSECTYVGRNRTICTDKVVTDNYPMSVDISVSKLTSPRNDFYKFLFKKRWNVPDCQ
jgi:hypothetical protein